MENYGKESYDYNSSLIILFMIFHHMTILHNFPIDIKGIVHNFFFYRSNLIFCTVMGCGIADSGRRLVIAPQKRASSKRCHGGEGGKG